MNLNRVQISGRLGRDPEMKSVGNAAHMCILSIATNEYDPSATGDKKTKALWHNVVVKDKTAKACMDNLKKGAGVYVEGRLYERTFDGQDGKSNRSMQIAAERVHFFR